MPTEQQIKEIDKKISRKLKAVTKKKPIELNEYQDAAQLVYIALTEKDWHFSLAARELICNAMEGLPRYTNDIALTLAKLIELEQNSGAEEKSKNIFTNKLAMQKRAMVISVRSFLSSSLEKHNLFHLNFIDDRAATNIKENKVRESHSSGHVKKQNAIALLNYFKTTFPQLEIDESINAKSLVKSHPSLVNLYEYFDVLNTIIKCTSATNKALKGKFYLNVAEIYLTLALLDLITEPFLENNINLILESEEISPIIKVAILYQNRNKSISEEYLSNKVFIQQLMDKGPSAVILLSMLKNNGLNYAELPPDFIAETLVKLYKNIIPNMYRRSIKKSNFECQEMFFTEDELKKKWEDTVKEYRTRQISYLNAFLELIGFDWKLLCENMESNQVIQESSKTTLINCLKFECKRSNIELIIDSSPERRESSASIDIPNSRTELASSCDSLASSYGSDCSIIGSLDRFSSIIGSPDRFERFNSSIVSPDRFSRGISSFEQSEEFCSSTSSTTSPPCTPEHFSFFSRTPSPEYGANPDYLSRSAPGDTELPRVSANYDISNPIKMGKSWYQ